MKIFRLVLTNNEKDYDLHFAVRNTDIAQKWYAELSKNYELYETDRLSNWGNVGLLEKINHHIDVVNSYEKIIDKKVDRTITQSDLNYLHKFFETLRGEIDKKTDWFIKAPEVVQNSVESFNILIHQLESDIRTKDKYPTAVVTFNNRPRLKLTQEDMKHFTYKWQKGTVYINYCQTGKTVLDAFKDKDNIAEVRPQTHYSADFMVRFGPSTNPIVYAIRQMLIEMWLRKKNYKFKNLNIGMIPVADIITNFNKQELLRYNKVKSVITDL
jgi:hypothetical protein